MTLFFSDFVKEISGLFPSEMTVIFVIVTMLVIIVQAVLSDSGSKTDTIQNFLDRIVSGIQVHEGLQIHTLHSSSRGHVPTTLGFISGKRLCIYVV